jgi:hypothetical protein
VVGVTHRFYRYHRAPLGSTCIGGGYAAKNTLKLSDHAARNVFTEMAPLFHFTGFCHLKSMFFISGAVKVAYRQVEVLEDWEAAQKAG